MNPYDIDTLARTVDTDPTNAVAWMRLADAWEVQGCFDWHTEIRQGVKEGRHPWTRQEVYYRWN